MGHEGEYTDTNFLNYLSRSERSYEVNFKEPTCASKFKSSRSLKEQDISRIHDE